MVDINKQDISQQSLNAALELMHFGFRSITAYPDQYLKSLGYSRVHHRVLYFIAQNPGTSINNLLAVMRISKQYLNRPLKRLIQDGYVSTTQDREDKRIKRLKLTDKGLSLEQALTGKQREHLIQVFKTAGPDAESGWRRVMDLLAKTTVQE